jgi:hypothetical protein
LRKKSDEKVDCNLVKDSVNTNRKEEKVEEAIRDSISKAAVSLCLQLFRCEFIRTTILFKPIGKWKEPFKIQSQKL